MKILYIISSTSIFGGSTKSFLRMFFELKNKGLEMQVVCPDRGPAYQILINEGITTYTIPTRFYIYPQYDTFKNIVLFIPRLINHFIVNTIAYYKIKHICIHEKFDIIHTNVSVVNVGERVANNLHIPHVYHIREYQDIDFKMKMIPTRSIYTNHLKKNNCICITKDIQKHFGLLESSSSVIYNGIKRQNKIIYNPTKENFFLFVGRIDPSKGFDMLLHAYAEFCQRNTSTKLFVAGMFIDTFFQQNVDLFIRDNNLQDHIVFLGLRSDVDKLMQSAKACIVASPFEGFGLVMAEAMFNGCLVLARLSSGTKEQIENGKALLNQSIALTYNTTHELASLMLEVSLQEPSIYQKTIQLSQKVVNKLYTIENNAQEVLLFYNTCLCRDKNI